MNIFLTRQSEYKESIGRREDEGCYATIESKYIMRVTERANFAIKTTPWKKGCVCVQRHQKDVSCSLGRCVATTQGSITTTTRKDEHSEHRKHLSGLISVLIRRDIIIKQFRLRLHCSLAELAAKQRVSGAHKDKLQLGRQ